MKNQSYLTTVPESIVPLDIYTYRWLKDHFCCLLKKGQWTSKLPAIVERIKITKIL